MMDRDGIIARRLALPFTAIGTGRMKIMSFDFDLPCGDIGTVFINDVLSCTSDGAPLAGVRGQPDGNEPGGRGAAILSVRAPARLSRAAR